MKTNKKRISLAMLLSGILIMTAGILLVMFSAGYLPIAYKPMVFSWQMLLIALGLVSLFKGYKPSIFLGTALIIVGFVFFVRDYPIFNYPVFEIIRNNIWPVLLIIGGLLIFIQSFFYHRFGKIKFTKEREEQSEELPEQKHYHPKFNFQDSEHAKEPGYIYQNYVFGGGKERLENIEFKGGEINCVFGGLSLDLRNTKLAEGVTILKINTVMGGAVLYIPIEWNVVLKKNHVFGNFEDHRPKPTFEIDDKSVLIIEVTSVFGGGEIKWNDKPNN